MISFPRRPSTIVAALSFLGVLFSSVLLVAHHNMDELNDAAFDRLRLFHELRSTALEDLIDSMRTEVRVASESTRVKQALDEFGSAWLELGVHAPQTLKRLYITENRFPSHERYNLKRAPDDSRYSLYHEVFHSWARRFLEHFGYYDVFLIDPKGNLIYTTAKEDDFATNLINGPLSNSNLGKTVRNAIQHPGEVAFSDFEFYAPSNDEPAAFAASAVKGGSGELLGVFAMQLPREPIEQLLNFSEGMGATGETYIVGHDLLMRNQSRFIDKPTLLTKTVATPAVREGLKGRAGARRIEDYRGVPVFSVWAPIEFGGKRGVLIAEIDEQEVLSNAGWAKWLTWR
jgi:methyl-accepting chemotaxis protein